jgi:hypothetical protein
VKTGTLFESSHVPLHKWLQAIYLCGYAELRSGLLSEILGVSFKTAAFMIDRIRYATANVSLGWSADTSGVSDDATHCERGRDNEEERSLRDQRSNDVIGAKRRDKPQFDRFLMAVARFRDYQLSDKFGATFGKIVKTRLKLSAWRRERTSNELPSDQG